ncbi:MAG TPA: response regulator transcription factor [Gaiellaceae bacterium]|jgi:DNA-binding NarL/FixJ family response regulator|nr:response regulator transcription factor [Gaiellaceae bacterium]
MQRPRCLVADDHPALATAVCDFLAGSGYEVVGPASDGPRAVTLARDEAPDLALVDYRMPRLEGPALVAQLREAAPGTAVVVYTADADEHVARAALAAGAAALVLKEAPLSDLGRALDAVRAGRAYVDAGVAHAGAPRAELTPRELDVLALVAEGLSHEQIGERLGIGGETVRTHLRKASARLGAATRTQAVASAIRRGLIE